MARAKKKKEELAEDIVMPADEMAPEGLTAEDFIAAADAEAEAQVEETEAPAEQTVSEEDAETVEAPAEDLALTQEDVRLVEAILFASSTAVTVGMIAERFPKDRVSLIPDVLEYLKEQYATRGVNLVQRDNRWALRTATDLGDQLRLEKEQPKKFTRAAMETMAIIAYHQPVTRAEIENIRGVATSPGALDALMEAGWIKPGKRREVPGRPVTWLSTQAFLDHFGLEKLEDLPGMEELKAAGLLDKRPAVEAMPTADMFDGETKAEQPDPQEVTDEDLIGQVTEEGESAAGLDGDAAVAGVVAAAVVAETVLEEGGSDGEDDEDSDLDDEDSDLDDEEEDEDEDDEDSDEDDESDEEDEEDDADSDDEDDESDDDEDDDDSDDEDDESDDDEDGDDDDDDGDDDDFDEDDEDGDDDEDDGDDEDEE